MDNIGMGLIRRASTATKKKRHQMGESNICKSPPIKIQETKRGDIVGPRTE